MNRHQILQYKPEGVANIYAPYIKVYGRTPQINSSPVPSNISQNYNFVTYPKQQTVSPHRHHSMYLEEKNSNFDDILEMVMDRYGEEEPTPRSVTHGSHYGVGGHGPQEKTSYSSYLQQSLSKEINCIRGMENVFKECAPGKTMECMYPGYVCCKRTRHRRSISRI